MKSNIPQPQSSVPLPREARFNPNGSDLINEKFNLPPSLPVRSMPMNQMPASNGLIPPPPQAPSSSFNYNDPDSFFAFLAPSETPDLPELDFPVPGPDVIPDMVFEHDHPEESVPKESGQHNITPPSIHPARPSEPYYASSSDYSQYDPSKRNSRDDSVSPRTSSSSISSISPRSADTSARGSVDNTPTTSASPSSDSLIPIQSSYVAHARVGTLSMAAIQERRARNTQSARRSRARRADKVAELRAENSILIARNKELTLENAELHKLVNTLQMIAPDVKPEVNESPYESF